MPWAASSLTLTHVAAGKPTVGGAGRAPWAASTLPPDLVELGRRDAGSDGGEHRVTGLGHGPGGRPQAGEVVVVIDGHECSS